jgi:phospholipid/cholesterol/gamma-HCH transport system permease protein
MKSLPIPPAAITAPTEQKFTLSGSWTALGIGAIERQLEALPAPLSGEIDAARIEALDTVGAWVLQSDLRRRREQGSLLTVNNLPEQFAALFDVVAQQITNQQELRTAPAGTPPSGFEALGRSAVDVLEQSLALLHFVGQCALTFAACLTHPARLRWRPILFNIRSAGFDALPIVGLLSFLLGIVVAYQGADQLRQYGANIFVADLVGLSMLREFAPLITAIIIAGRSGSAYAAQIGTMSVTEEIDAMRTLGIAPLDLLVVPKIVALLIALPLLTLFADLLGVFGGMLMARAQLGVGFPEFIERFVKAVSVTAYLTGLFKAPVFAVIIAVIGCFQGFRTAGGADSVGRQTTRSVVQSIFLVIVADALFSVAFSALDL